MNTYYLTFTQRAVGLKDGWVEATAPDEDTVRRWARETYGDLWSGIYTEEEHEGAYYPRACLGRVKFN